MINPVSAAYSAQQTMPSAPVQRQAAQQATQQAAQSQDRYTPSMGDRDADGDSK